MNRNYERFIGDPDSIVIGDSEIDDPQTTAELYGLLRVTQSPDDVREAAVADWLAWHRPSPSLQRGIERAAARREQQHVHSAVDA